MPKRILKVLFVLAFGFIFFVSVGLIAVFVYNDGGYDKNAVYDYAVVFGAAIRSKGKLSNTLKSRMETAIKLYKEGRVKKLILSGAVRREMKPGEPLAMYQFAVSRQVPSYDIILDESGDNTMQTLIYTKKLLSKEKVRILFVSSYFHLARIKITSDVMGLKNCDYYPSENNHPTVAAFVFREALAIWYYIPQAVLNRIRY